jgi:hypothetical protein
MDLSPHCAATAGTDIGSSGAQHALLALEWSLSPSLLRGLLLAWYQASSGAWPAGWEQWAHSAGISACKLAEHWH